MATDKTDQPTANVRVRSFEELISPGTMRTQYPIDPRVANHVKQSRHSIHQCLNGDDSRLLVIVGPCSIHDVDAGLDYACRLAKLAQQVNDKMLVIMRVYFEKPRTTVGWKGLINDPRLDGSHDILSGLQMARQFLLEVNRLGLPCATEFLDPIVPQYTSDLVSWAAIGARTTESQTHRELASGLSMPVGFKNATDGGLQVARDAMISAQSGHAFLGIDENGHTSVVNTAGNRDVHMILRGGGGKSNYSPADIAKTKSMLAAQNGPRLIMVDCSHGNSHKDFTRQPEVFRDMVKLYRTGEQAIVGLMLESFIKSGKQSIESKPLIYGQSVTDGCLDWQSTEELILDSYKSLCK